MTQSTELFDIIPAAPQRVFAAWLDAAEHTKMTGGQATDEGEGRFTAWDAYITGQTVSAVPHSKIVQRWRTTEFPDGAPDSLLTIALEPDDGGTKLTLTHEDIPDGQAEAYHEGWKEHYFTPMKAYFSTPTQRMRAVGDKFAHSVEEMTQQLEAVTEDALEAVDHARVRARKQAVKAIKAVQRVQKKTSARLKAVGKKAKALVSRKPSKAASKTKAKTKGKAKTKSVPSRAKKPQASPSSPKKSARRANKGPRSSAQ